MIGTRPSSPELLDVALELRVPPLVLRAIVVAAVLGYDSGVTDPTLVPVPAGVGCGECADRTSLSPRF